MALSINEKHEWIVCNLEELSRSYFISREINERLSMLDVNSGSLAPYQHICNVLVADFAVRWCKVFGSNKEEMHWKQFVENEVDFRSLLKSSVRMTSDEYYEYWLALKTLRDQVVAHFNFKYVGKEVPEFESALEIASAAHGHFNARLIEYGTRREPFDLKYFGKSAAERFLLPLRPELI